MSNYIDLPITGGGGVSSLNGQTGALSLVAGTNITIVPGAGTLTINGTAATGANQSLSNLTNPTAVNQTLTLNNNLGVQGKGTDTFNRNLVNIDNSNSINISSSNANTFVYSNNIDFIPSSGIMNIQAFVSGATSLLFYAADTATYTGLKAAATASNTTFTLPAADGSSGQFLSTNGSGVLSFATPTGTGVASINGDATAAQTLTTGTTGTDFAIVNNGIGDHKFNLPTASAVNRGALSSADWTTFNNKQSTVTIGALDAQTANANGLALVSNVLSSQSATASFPGMVNLVQQTFAGNKTFASIGINDTSAGAGIFAKSPAIGTKTQVIKAIAGQTATLLEVQDSVGTVEMQFTAGGNFQFYNTVATPEARMDLRPSVSSTTSSSGANAKFGVFIGDPTSPQTTGVGSGIAFGGVQDAIGTATEFGYIWTTKDNSTAGNIDSSMHFATRNNATGFAQRVLDMDASGNSSFSGFVGINVAAAANTPLDVVANTASATQVEQLTGYGANNIGIRIRHARGTSASPTALLSGDPLGFIGARGYGASQFAAQNTSSIQFTAIENFTNTANGTSIIFNATPTGSVTLAEAARIASTGVTLGPQSASTAIHQINGGIYRTTRTITTNLTIDTTTTDDIIYCNNTGAITVTLPTPTNGRVLTIKDIKGTASTNNITIAQHAAESLEGLATSFIFQTNYGSITWGADGTNWWILS